MVHGMELMFLRINLYEKGRGWGEKIRVVRAFRDCHASFGWALLALGRCVALRMEADS